MSAATKLKQASASAVVKLWATSMRPSTLQVAFENLQLLSLTSSTPQDGCCHVHHNLLNSSETKITLGMCPEFVKFLESNLEDLVMMMACTEDI
jgi:hypothetical protein